MSDKIIRNIEELSDREKKVIQERIGLFGIKPKSRREIIEMFAISEDRLKQLEEKTIRLLRR